MVYYISPTGNDTTGNGTIGNPWLTVVKAYNSSVSGDTIYLLPGTYTMENVTFYTARIVTSASATTAIMDAAGTQKTWITNLTQNISNITFKNNYLGSMGNVIKISYSGVGNNLTVTNCMFDNVRTYADGNERCGIFGSEYLNYDTINVNISACLFKNIVGNGISNGNIIGFNRVTGAVNFTNNTVHAKADTYILGSIVRAYLGNYTFTVKNNIFYNASGGAVYFVIGFSPSVVIFNNNDSYLITSVPSGSGNITSDPLFIDVANNNFSLRPTSPCVDLGSIV